MKKNIHISFEPDVEAGHITETIVVNYYNELHYALIRDRDVRKILDDQFRTSFNRDNEGRIGDYKIEDPAQALFLLGNLRYDEEFKAWVEEEVNCLISALNNGDKYIIGNHIHGEPTPLEIWEEREDSEEN